MHDIRQDAQLQPPHSTATAAVRAADYSASIREREDAASARIEAELARIAQRRA
jgi:hypothetical protein